MRADSFCIKFSYRFTTDNLKAIFSEIGTIREVKDSETEYGVSYEIYMDLWSKKGELFRNTLIEKGRYDYYYDADEFLMCEPL